MRCLRKILFLCLVVHAAAGGVFAQTLSDTLSIEEIRITSFRPLQRNSLSLTRLDSLVLQNKANSSLSEVLAEHSGIFIKTYGRGAMATASFRGTDPSHTKVLWNGIELNSPMLGMVDFSLIPVFFIDNVELLHGSGSVAETSGALGGVINLSTEPDWTNRFSGSYMQGTGSFGSHDEHLRINLGSGKIQSQTRLFYAHSNNDFSFTNYDIIDSVDLESGTRYYPRMTNRDAWFSYYGLLQEIHYRPGEKDFFSMSFWGQESSRSIPLLSTSETGANNNINRQEDKSIRGQISYLHYGENFSLKAFSGLNSMDLDYSQKNRLNDQSYLVQIDSKSQTSSLYNSLDFQLKVSSDLRVELSAGADYHQVESLEKIKIFGYNESRIQSRVSGSVFKGWNSKWNSSLRLGSDFIGREKAMPVFHMGSEYHILPAEKLYLKFILASNAKYPSLNDLYYQPGGNPDLKPERSFDQELGIHFSTGKRGLTFSQDVMAYMSQVQNWIMWQYKLKGFSPGNIEKVDVKGIETNATLSYTSDRQAYKISSGYALTHSRDMGKMLSESDDSYGKQLPYIPVHSANAMLYLMRNNWSLTYIWNFYSRRNTTTSNDDSVLRDRLDSYCMNQAGLGKQVQLNDWKLDVNLKVHNLFNLEYRSILQRPMPGRNYSLQLKLCF